MRAHTRILLAAMSLAATSSVVAEETHGNLHYCTTDSECKTGNRIENPGYSTEPWVPFDSDNLFVWAADACLGYFMTRGAEALDDGVVKTFDDGAGAVHVYVELGDYTKDLAGAARLHIFNYPFNEYGVFTCENTTWPLLQFDSEEFQHWVERRMLAEQGWHSSKFFGGDVAQFRNEKFGAIIRVYAIAGEYRFHLEADYFGPPIVLQ